MKIVLLIAIFFSVLNAEFVRNNRTDIVKDTTLNLQWQDNAVSGKMTLKDAKNYCSNLSLRGFGWRLPNQKELRSIVDKSNFYPAISSAFTKTSLRVSNSMYWSTTPFIGNKDGMWLVGFWAGGDHYSTVNYQANVRCVRKAQ